VFGDDYAGLGNVVASLCLGTFARLLVFPIDAVLLALQQGRVLLMAALVRLALICGVGIPLIWWTGLVGVGFAMALSCLGAAFVQWYMFLRDGEIDDS
jgi:O-antigen/teichoic acid export membrane protein